MKLLWLFSILPAALATSLQATVIIIPNDHSTIQAGIDAAANGDTVLVQPGTYVENINFNGKNIVVGSLFLTTGDTSYIRQTVIDGDSIASVVTFESGEDSTARLSGFKITNGWGTGSWSTAFGGGISCRESSNPTLDNLVISGNRAENGGGITINKSGPSISNLVIKENQVDDSGGGIYIVESNNAVIMNSVIENNKAFWFGGGIHSQFSNYTLRDIAAVQNQAITGGGINCQYSEVVITNARFTGNTGGGIHSGNSTISISASAIISNSSPGYGGGIRCHESSILFDSVARCNIHSNVALLEGSDIYNLNSGIVHVVVDTFTVMSPSSRQAWPFEEFTFDIWNAKVERVSADLYVNPTGNDTNSGLSATEPLRTITHALLRIAADSLNPHQIRLAAGTYSLSTTGEVYPLSIPSYVTVIGDSETSCILDAEGKICYKGGVVRFQSVRGAGIENITMTRGYASTDGGGIYCYKSEDITMQKSTIVNNRAISEGGGIYITASKVTLSHIKVLANSVTRYGGGIHVSGSSRSIFEYVLVRDNKTRDIHNGAGGGLSMRGASPVIRHTSVVHNTSAIGSGINIGYLSFPLLVNVTISGNVGYEGDSDGGIVSSWSGPILVNTILWNDSPHEIIVTGPEDLSVQLFFSNIKGGWPGTANISVDPLFIDTLRADFHLQATSPCIDAGTPLFVLNGDTLVNMDSADYVGSAPDMGAFEYGSTVAIDLPRPAISRYALHSAFPNPFNPVTTIRYDLPHASEVILTVYDLRGREVARLVDGFMEAGYHEVRWNGQKFASGIYIARLAMPEYSKTIKMVLLK